MILKNCFRRERGVKLEDTWNHFQAIIVRGVMSLLEISGGFVVVCACAAHLLIRFISNEVSGLRL